MMSLVRICLAMNASGEAIVLGAKTLSPVLRDRGLISYITLDNTMV